MQTTALLLVSGLALAGCAGVSASVTPAQFRATMQRDGAQETVQTLYANPASTTLAQVNQGISTGADQWLAVVPLISTGTDASTSTDLRDALVEALLRNPAGVLRVIGDPQTSDFLKESACFPMDELVGAPALSYITNARRAVEAVNDPALQAAKTRCLANLRQAQSESGS